MAPKGSHVCGLCDTSYAAKTSLDAHMCAKHGAPKPKCPHCDKTFSDGTNLNRHVRKAHTNGSSKLWRCSGCNKTFDRKHNAMRHLATKRERENSPHGSIEEVAPTAGDNSSASEATAPRPRQRRLRQQQQQQKHQQQPQEQEQQEEQQQHPAHQHVDNSSTESPSWSTSDSMPSYSEDQLAQVLNNADDEWAQKLLVFANGLVSSSTDMGLDQKALCLEQLESAVSTAPHGARYRALVNLMVRLGMPAKDVTKEAVTGLGAQFPLTPEQREQEPTASSHALDPQLQTWHEEQQSLPMDILMADGAQPSDEMSFVEFLNAPLEIAG